MCCAVLDAKRSYYYPNRLRINILKKLLSKKDVTSVSGQSGSVFEVLDDDVSSSTFPAELLTKVSGYFIYTLIALSMLLIINWKLPDAIILMPNGRMEATGGFEKLVQSCKIFSLILSQA